MPASEAQVRANQANSLKSTGPRTAEGKETSRANAYKHGLTAAKVLPEHEAVEVDRRSDAFRRELAPSGEVGMALVRLAATMSVRMERCVEHENAALADRVRRAEADFVAPEGVDEAEAGRLRAEAGKRALFDPSREATLARKYEAAAQRSFFRALKELRAVERQVEAAREGEIDAQLASIMPGEMTDEEFDAMYAEATRPGTQAPIAPANPVDFSTLGGRFDVPFTIGRRR